MKKIYVIILVVLVGVGAFLGGIQYQKSQHSSVRLGQFGGQGQFTNRVGQQGERPVTGSIISSDDTSITVKLMDGSTKIVLFSGATIVNKQTIGLKADLKAGDRVLVIGKNNSDGSVTADSISLNPMLRGVMGTPSAH